MPPKSQIIWDYSIPNAQIKFGAEHSKFCASQIIYGIPNYLLYNTQLSDIMTSVTYCGIVSVICNALSLLVKFHFIAVSFIVCNALKFFPIIIGQIFSGFLYY